MKVDCTKHYGKCGKVTTILNEDFYQGNNEKSILYVSAHGEAWMQMGDGGYFSDGESRRLVESSFGERKLQDSSAGDAEFEVVLELEEASGSRAMVAGSAFGAIACMIVAVLVA